MTPDDFWKLLEGLEPEEAEQQLTERLERLSAANVIQFETHFIHVFAGHMIGSFGEQPT